MWGTEKLFHALQRKCITGIGVEASRKRRRIRVGPCVVSQDEATGWSGCRN